MTAGRSPRFDRNDTKVFFTGKIRADNAHSDAEGLQMPAAP